MSQLRLSFSALVISGMLFTVACGPSGNTSTESNPSTVQQQESNEAKPGTGQFCGGFAAIQCPEGLVCVDDPNDSCDPSTGGADCGGICVKGTSQTAEKKKCDYNDPTRFYAARSPEECAAVTFICVEGQTAFFDECGCGCETNR
ncbi:hypothetical protein ATI61_110188 [Archangium gephyra]|uniref:Kazal-type serine protease inhibitor domain protein n=1 Tax=Archangium gephyra TaxID=48 RepID=A0AAC8QE42_9BACT|nr:hypothetical protein [Archangium gephyra]AKJ06067.1 Kazal-type serine protease inhibitor domain protein [Archangium gephyra]REG27181.1 hypothetical protein ATI61_110188 [Archangium gephyra]